MADLKSRLTVGELKEHLAVFSDDYVVFFGPGGSNELTFYRTKLRGDKLVQVEFNELYEVTDRLSI